MLFADACGRIQFSWNVLEMNKNYCTRIFFLLVKNAKTLLELSYKCDFQKHEWETSRLKFFVSLRLDR